MPPRVGDSSVSAFEDLFYEREVTPRFRPLGIILDIDGTLIAETEDDNEGPTEFVRPGAVEFLHWCLSRGHSLALWTAAHPSWANYCAWKLCTQIQEQAYNASNSSSSSSNSCEASSSTSGHEERQRHCCSGVNCRKHFDFVWARERMRIRKRIPVSAHGEYDGCRWCEDYRRQCDRCECHGSRTNNANGGAGKDSSCSSTFTTSTSSSSASHSKLFGCPCRSTKNLSKVWRKQKKHHFSEAFSRERTIIVENTPQQCIANYGNAVYVPTYNGCAALEILDPIFHRLKTLILQMEQVDDVRTVVRCNHGPAPHACFEQTWWTAPTPVASSMPPSAYCLPVGSSPEQYSDDGDESSYTDWILEYEI